MKVVVFWLKYDGRRKKSACFIYSP